MSDPDAPDQPLAQARANRAEARTSLEKAVTEVQGMFGAMIQRADWSGDRNRVRMEGAGFWVEMSVDDRHVHATGDIPFLAGLLGGPLGGGLKKVLEQNFPEETDLSGPCSLYSRNWLRSGSRHGHKTDSRAAAGVRPPRRHPLAVAEAARLDGRGKARRGRPPQIGRLLGQVSSAFPLEHIVARSLELRAKALGLSSGTADLIGLNADTIDPLQTLLLGDAEFAELVKKLDEELGGL